MPNDEQFRRQFETATVAKASLARYYLRSLEMQAKEEPAPYFVPNDDSESINLEHVLPVKPEGNWPQFTDDVAKLDARRIGNLALLKAKHNSDPRSADFATKKAAYAGTPYKLTQQIATADEWTHENIVMRQLGLAKIALKTWPL